MRHKPSPQPSAPQLMVVFESRFPSVYSLQQLEDESAAGAAPLGKPSNPQGQVSAVVGQYLPKIMFGGPPQLTRLERTAPDFLDYGDTTDSRCCLQLRRSCLLGQRSAARCCACTDACQSSCMDTSELLMCPAEPPPPPLSAWTGWMRPRSKSWWTA